MLYIVLGLGGFYLVWLVGIQPIFDKMKTLDGQISATKRALHVEKSYLKRQETIEQEWETTLEEVQNPEREMLKGPFDYVQKLIDRTIKSESRRPSYDRPKKEQQGDFMETWVMVTDAKFKIDEWIQFLVELANEKDFLNVRRLELKSRFDRPEKVLAVEMKLSTIEYSPVVSKARGKKRGGR